MSYTPGFAPDALSQFRDLGISLQELVLDELEIVAMNPPVGRRIEFLRDTVLTTATVRHYLFLRFTLDHVGHRVTLVGIVVVSATS